MTGQIKKSIYIGKSYCTYFNFFLNKVVFIVKLFFNEIFTMNGIFNKIKILSLMIKNSFELT